MFSLYVIAFLRKLLSDFGRDNVIYPNHLSGECMKNLLYIIEISEASEWTFQLFSFSLLLLFLWPQYNSIWIVCMCLCIMNWFLSIKQLFLLILAARKFAFRSVYFFCSAAFFVCCYLRSLFLYYSFFIRAKFLPALFASFSLYSLLSPSIYCLFSALALSLRTFPARDPARSFILLLSFAPFSTFCIFPNWTIVCYYIKKEIVYASKKKAARL